MLPAPRIVLPLKVLLVLASMYALVLFALSVPGSFSYDLAGAPRDAPILWPVFIAVELAIAGFLLVVVCTWRLLTLVRHDRIFSEDSMRWVTIIVRTFLIGWLVLVALSAYLIAVIYLTPELRDPGVAVLLVGFVLLGAVLVMVVAVLRTLLRRAKTMQDDLDGVL